MVYKNCTWNETCLSGEDGRSIVRKNHDGLYEIVLASRWDENTWVHYVASNRYKTLKQLYKEHPEASEYDVYEPTFAK